MVNQYSTLILVIVTMAYVLFTRRMVVEMRKAREQEMEPVILTTIIAIGAKECKLRIQNVGFGPAINMKAEITNKADRGDTQIWNYPAMISNGYEDFFLPINITSNIPKNNQNSENIEKIIIVLSWSNIFEKGHSEKRELFLNYQNNDWYKTHQIIQPKDLLNQLNDIRIELKGIKEEFENSKRFEKEEIINLLEKAAQPARAPDAPTGGKKSRRRKAA